MITAFGRWKISHRISSAGPKNTARGLRLLFHFYAVRLKCKYGRLEVWKWNSRHLPQASSLLPPASSLLPPASRFQPHASRATLSVFPTADAFNLLPRLSLAIRE